MEISILMGMEISILMGMEISILMGMEISILMGMEISRSYGNGDINSYICSSMNTLEKAGLTDLQFRSPGHRWQKNEMKKKEKKKNTSNCKALWLHINPVSRDRKEDRSSYQ